MRGYQPDKSENKPILPPKCLKGNGYTRLFKPENNMETKRIQFDLSIKMHNELQAVQELLDMTTFSELVRRALKEIQLRTAMQQRGYGIYAIQEDSNEKMLMALPLGEKK